MPVLSTQYAGWFYVMHCEFHQEHIYKLGYTNEIDITMRALQHTRETTSPGEFRIVMAVWTKDAHGFEQNEIFKLFASQRLQKKYPGSSKEPEFFKIEKGSFEWNTLESKLDQEIRHGGVKWSESHVKYHSTDLVGPFEQTIENKKIIQEDVAEMEKEEQIQEDQDQDQDQDQEDQEPLNSLVEALESLNIDTSFDSDESNDVQPEYDIEKDIHVRIRGPKVKYDIERLNHGDIVETPVRITWSRDPRLNKKELTMKARYNARMKIFEDLDSSHTFKTLIEMCTEFVRRLGWNDALGEVFAHSVIGKAVEHKKNNNTIAWHTMFVVDGTSKISLGRIIS